ncbi:MAG TPA: ATP-binding protein [Terriglobales bacterium]|nr:ATP-binding protein [Terriglobales bacterium]
MALDDLKQAENPKQAGNLKEDFRGIAIFSDLSDEDLQWLADHAEESRFAPGEIMIREGAPADAMIIYLEGETEGRVEQGADDGRVYSARAGDVTGMLPYSRLKIIPLTIRAIIPTRIALIPAALFDEMLHHIPVLRGRLVSLLADRVREVTKADQQRERLAALGKLSAGLAHELNNPAAAARRAANTLGDTLQRLYKACDDLQEVPLSTEASNYLCRFESELLSRPPAPPLDPLAQSEREEAMSDWLAKGGVSEPWKFAPELVESGITTQELRELHSHCPEIPPDNLANRIVSKMQLARLAREIENATARISELVKAIKEYSFMDQAPVQDVDVRNGLESTLTILNHKLKHGISVIRNYASDIPRIPSYGSELNQVWTNLIDNAADAMNGKGELRIRVAQEDTSLLVEIRDNGPGIPAEIQPHIFEPFFTTKDVGKGTGLGLDTVYRIIRKHHGTISFVSRPGDTCFRVRLPVQRPLEPLH